MLYLFKKIYAIIKNFSIQQHAQRVVKIYEKYEYRFGPIAMLAGVTVDFIAFQRIDVLFENMVLLGYLLIGGIGITIVNLYEGGRLWGKIFDRLRLYLPLLIQFSFGGLFSAFMVFYLKSASFATSWPFFVILLVLIVGNEFFRTRYLKLTFHMSIYFLAVYSYAIFLLPIFVKQIGPWVFIASGVISVAFIVVFIYFLSKMIPARIREARQSVLWSIRTIFVFINLFYFANIIPPIPLALNESGIYHEVSRKGDTYQVITEEKKWYHIFLQKSIHIAPGEPVYVFSAVFAPTDFNIRIIHHWQYQDEQTGNWITADKLPYPIIGGRDGGYRGYSFKHAVFPGDWRVDVETENGQDIGRATFSIKEAGSSAPLRLQDTL